ncbi:hypothetical protein TNCV_5004811 [Trichonephila clavipes]|uniref:Uncharacterized protein n=1 Tax=Trichonephila clavipes TaxID=2585209 RepID=A0A8X6RG98_TRICX|nr:hypothetical protein TNCV_5004811 [Trichonephila clavipes]
MIQIAIITNRDVLRSKPTGPKATTLVKTLSRSRLGLRLGMPTKPSLRLKVLLFRRNVYLEIATEKETPTNRSILQWLHQFKKTNSLCKKKSSGRPSVSEEVVETVRQSFIRSPRECTRVAARELEIPKK